MTDGVTVLCPKVKFRENSWKIVPPGRNLHSIQGAATKVPFQGMSSESLTNSSTLLRGKGFMTSAEQKDVWSRPQKAERAFILRNKG